MPVKQVQPAAKPIKQARTKSSGKQECAPDTARPGTNPVNTPVRERQAGEAGEQKCAYSRVKPKQLTRCTKSPQQKKFARPKSAAVFPRIDSTREHENNNLRMQLRQQQEAVARLQAEVRRLSRHNSQLLRENELLWNQARVQAQKQRPHTGHRPKSAAGRPPTHPGDARRRREKQGRRQRDETQTERTTATKEMDRARLESDSEQQAEEQATEGEIVKREDLIQEEIRRILRGDEPH